MRNARRALGLLTAVLIAGGLSYIEGAQSPAPETIVLKVMPSNYVGACPAPLTFSLVVTGAPAATKPFRYRIIGQNPLATSQVQTWKSQVTGPDFTLTLNTQVAQTLSSGWAAVQIFSSDNLTSQQSIAESARANFQVSCTSSRLTQVLNEAPRPAFGPPQQTAPPNAQGAPPPQGPPPQSVPVITERPVIVSHPVQGVGSSGSGQSQPSTMTVAPPPSAGSSSLSSSNAAGANTSSGSVGGKVKFDASAYSANLAALRQKVLQARTSLKPRAQLSTRISRTSPLRTQRARLVRMVASGGRTIAVDYQTARKLTGTYVSAFQHTIAQTAYRAGGLTTYKVNPSLGLFSQNQPTAVPLPIETVDAPTLSSAVGGETFDTALNAPTPYVTQGISSALPGYPPNTANSPSTPIMIPFFVNSPNLTIRVPASLYYFTSGSDTNPYAGLYRISVVVQELALDSNGNPETSASDPSGYQWNNLSSTQTGPLPPGTGQNEQSPPLPSPVWMLDTNAAGILTAGGGSYGYIFEDASGWNGSSSANTLDFSVSLPSIANFLRIAITPTSYQNAPIAGSVYSGTIPVVVSPTGFVQLKCLPLMILYQPPGDASTVDYSQSQTYSTGFTLSSGSNQGSSLQQVTGQTVTSSGNGGFSFPSLPVIGSIAASLSYSMQQSWSNNTTTSNSATNTSSNSFTLTGTVSQDWKQTAGNPAKGQPYAAPYWSDVFILSPHPQLALWDLLPPQASSSNPGRIEVGFMGTDTTDPVFSVTASQLDTCANATDTEIQLTETVYLQQTDCQGLLTLDPFYVNGQSYAPPSDVATSEAPINAGSANTADTLSFTESTNTAATQATSSAFSSTIDSTIGSTTTLGLSASFSAGNSGGLSGGGSNQTSNSSSTTTGSTFGLTLTNTAANSATMANTSTRSIADDGNTAQLPILGQSYVDSRFGTWMFQSVQPHTCYSQFGNGCSTPCANLLRTATDSAASPFNCSPPCSPAGTSGSAGSGAPAQFDCPAVASTTGAWTPASNVAATASCGDSIVINGSGFTGTTQVEFIPTGGANGGVAVYSPASSLNVVSDDIVSAQLNAGGNPTNPTQAVVYNVAVSGQGFANEPIIVGQLSVTGTCQ